jgi:zeaxanthin glucosyltransferase
VRILRCDAAGLYVALGIFLLVAVRSPSAYRSLIAFAAWSSLAHAVVMSVQALPNTSMRGDLYGSAGLVVIGIALLVLWGRPRNVALERGGQAPMPHFGFFCLPATGHINPMATLADELQARGHLITFYQIEDCAAQILAVGLRCETFGRQTIPRGSMPEFFAKLGRLRGRAGMAYTLEFLLSLYEAALQELPESLRRDPVDTLVVDQAFHPVGSIAEHLGVPFVNICNCLMLNEDVGVPPFNRGWSYDPGWCARLRNRGAIKLLNLFMYQPFFRLINKTRREWGLREIRRLNDVFSTLAQIAQQPPEFEFPRRDLPTSFYFTGPFHRAKSRVPIDFPWDRLDGRPLVFASMGTVQNGMEWVFRIIAEACDGLGIQLVMSLGGNITPENLGRLSGNPLTVCYAPQLELLQRARLVITHAGLNTALESLTQGVPMVAIPVTNDQPAVAARIAWTGTGEVVPLKKLNARRLRAAIVRVMETERYRLAAHRMKDQIAERNGLTHAADLVERFCVGKPGS